MTDFTEGILYSNEIYKVYVGLPVRGESKALCYLVENKQTGVVEIETSVLVTACLYADDYADQYNSFVMSKVEV